MTCVTWLAVLGCEPAVEPTSDGAIESDAGSSARRDGGGRDVDDGGARDAGVIAIDAGAIDAGPEPTGTPTFVAVGYQSVRIHSSDLGENWSEPVAIGPYADNEHVLSGVTWHDGRFVAVGWKVWTSSDGVSWVERTHPVHQWFSNVHFGQGVFSAVGAYTAWSPDGVTWTEGTSLSGASDSMDFGGGAFMAATRDGEWWRSTDGRAWSLDSSDHGSERIVWCDTAFSVPSECDHTVVQQGVAYAGGVFMRIHDDVDIERSEDGVTWERVYRGEHDLNDITVGFVP